MKHFLRLRDLQASDLAELLDLAIELKARHLRGIHEHGLTGKVLGLIFEKASTRTRFSFDNSGQVTDVQILTVRS